jgi:hypothetical protein
MQFIMCVVFDSIKTINWKTLYHECTRAVLPTLYHECMQIVDSTRQVTFIQFNKRNFGPIVYIHGTELV